MLFRSPAELQLAIASRLEDMADQVARLKLAGQDDLAELVREGEDVRELSCRKLGVILNVGKTTVAEDMARLQNPRKEQDAHTSETES